MKIRSHINYRAFSIIEVAVVIIIVGILIIGISKGVDLYRDAKLVSAKNYTNSSIVGRIPNLVFWVDTTDDDNLKASLVADVNNSQFGKISNNSNISAWRDKGPQALNKLTVFASTDDRRPLYVVKGINDLPSLYFNGNQTLSTFTPPLPAGQKQFTMMAIYQKELQAGAEYVVSQNSNPTAIGTHANFYIHNLSGGILFNCCGALVSSTPFVAKKNYFTIAKVDTNLTSNNISMWVNKSVPDIGNLTSLNLGAGVLSIGSRNDGFLRFRGLISEIIVFDRALEDREIADVIAYFTKKYNIALQ